MIRLFRIYLSAYPLWYRFLVVFCLPVVAFILHFIPGMWEEGQELYFLMFCGSVLVLLEVEGEFLSLGGIYRKAEPFGTLVLTSARGGGYMQSFAVADLIRRGLLCIIVFLLPGLLFGKRSPAEGFSTAVIAFGAIQFGVWMVRHIFHQMMMFLAMMTGLLIYGFFTIFYSASEGGLRIVILLMAVVLSAVTAVLSMNSMKKAERKCYYDKETEL